MKSNMRITDNKQDIQKEEFVATYPKISQVLLDRSLDDLSKNDSIFVFPNDLEQSDDLEKKNKVLESFNGKIKTSNIIGFLGCGQERLTISSRFSERDNDYFLHYMLQKVFNFNLTHLDVGFSDEDRFYQLLVYLFPNYLQAALRKGLYKEYQCFSYNDRQVRGTIDVARHIKKNIPFRGEIAYTTREFTYDNPLMQLVRHTIDFIQTNITGGREILVNSSQYRENVAEIIRVTPTYRCQDRAKIIRFNQTKPLRHAYYQEYRKLQQLCIWILSRRKHGLGTSSEQVHGILFDVAWLWEEYVNTLLPAGFIHPRNKKKEEGISIFSSRKRTIFPDFYHEKFGIVLDAKYKKLELTEKGIDRADLYQMVTYCYILEAKLGGFVFPSQESQVDNDIGKLAGYGASLKKWSIQIPQGNSSYREFVAEIEHAEDIFFEKLRVICCKK